ncbi:MAG: ATP-dependent DNA helicase [Candidatus Nitrosopolaris sp.]
MRDNHQTTVDDLIKNFPFPTLREKQSFVLKEIGAAFASGYRHIILEAPTGFGKSPVAVAAGLTLGSSYVCTATKDLQTQYARDFPFVKPAKGKGNFSCEVKDDFIRNGTYKCKPCVSTRNDCPHTTVEYGPCMSDDKYICKYKTLLKDYKVSNKSTKREHVFLSPDTQNHYQDKYFQWSHLENLKENIKRDWRPCEYYDQLSIAIVASHSVLNYSIFLALIHKNLPSRELLVLDEAHLLEMELVRFRGISISKKKWRKYIPDLKIQDHGYDVKEWTDFLSNLKDMMINANILNEELLVEASQDIDKLELTINSIVSNSRNWIVSEIKKEGHEVIKVELKPLDVSPYCKDVFRKCNKTLMMSATILDAKTFCKNIGLEHDDVKIIRVGSDFPLQNRLIYPLDTAYLNYINLQKDAVKISLAKTIDDLMTRHKDNKGIIHTTSYDQLNFIKENISQTNKRRLLVTDPVIERDEVIAEHAKSAKPTVLISPSLHIGLDLKDDLSRFQIITKVPYPSLGDKWIDEKRKINEQWYSWQTALRLVQGYGRSVRSKEDWAITYVLDSAFGLFVNKNKNILPDWFTQAIVRTKH